MCESEPQVPVLECFTSMHLSYAQSNLHAVTLLRICRSFRIVVHDDVQCSKPELRFSLSRRLSVPELLIPAADAAFYMIILSMVLRMSPTAVSVY